MRASKILSSRPERAIVALAQLCEERPEEELLHASPSRSQFAPPRLSAVPQAAQTPYTIGSNPMRPTGAPEPDRLSPPEVHQVPVWMPPPNTRISVTHPEHMAPKRAKWTSPPPPEAPEADRSAFEDKLGHSLSMATSSNAREQEHDGASSSANSEIFTDDEDIRSVVDSEDARSVRSLTDDRVMHRMNGQSFAPPTQFWQKTATNDPSNTRYSLRINDPPNEINGDDQQWTSKTRGRPQIKVPHFTPDNTIPFGIAKARQDGFVPPPRMEPSRRATSGPGGPLRNLNRHSVSALPTVVTPISAYPSRSLMVPHSPQLIHERANDVFYETAPLRKGVSRALNVEQPSPVTARFPSFSRLEGIPRSDNSTPQYRNATPRHLVTQTESPLSMTPSQATVSLPYTRLTSHVHSHSQSTIIAPTPSSSGQIHLSDTSIPSSPPSPHSLSCSRSRSRSRSVERSSSLPSTKYLGVKSERFRTSSPASVSSASGSPPMSCASSQYAPSISPVSTSPPSPAHSDTFVQPIVKLGSSIPEKQNLSPIAPVTPKPQLREDKEQPRVTVVHGEEAEELAAAAKVLSLDP